MNERKYRSYPEVFKLEALALLMKKEKSAGQIERELGITPGLLVKWRTRYQAFEKGIQEAHLEPSDLEAVKAEIRRLQRELAAAKDERNALKSSQHFLTKTL